MRPRVAVSEVMTLAPSARPAIDPAPRAVLEGGQRQGQVMSPAAIMAAIMASAATGFGATSSSSASPLGAGLLQASDGFLPTPTMVFGELHDEEEPRG